MARWPVAIYQPVPQCSGTLRPIAVCLHHQAGSGNPASVYASRNVSAHFWIPKSGTPVQHVDTSVRSWHGGGTLNDTSIGVETEGCGAPPHSEPLNEHQLSLFGSLMAWAADVHGIPLVKSETATTPGLNYHRCQGGFNTACPCDARLSQRDEILRRAGGGSSVGAPTEKKGSQNMIASTSDGDGYWIVKPDGAVYNFGTAGFYGAANDPDAGGPEKAHLQPGHVIVGIAGKGNDGYWLTADDGSVYTYGSAQFHGRPDR